MPLSRSLSFTTESLSKHARGGVEEELGKKLEKADLQGTASFASYNQSNKDCCDTCQNSPSNSFDNTPGVGFFFWWLIVRVAVIAPSLHRLIVQCNNLM